MATDLRAGVCTSSQSLLSPALDLGQPLACLHQGRPGACFLPSACAPSFPLSTLRPQLLTWCKKPVVPFTAYSVVRIQTDL